MLRRIFASASLLVIVAQADAQQCAQKRNSSGGLLCTQMNAVCSPVTDGTGTVGHCESLGRGDSQTCECVGQLGFSIRLVPHAGDLIQGRTLSVLATVDPDEGFKGSIALKASNLPAGTSAAFVPSIVSGRTPSSSTLTITATPTAKLGLDIVDVEGTSGSMNANAHLELEIKPPPNAQLWGFADLHAHPATFLGFGSDPSGSNGLFWGKPGKELLASSTDAAIAADLPFCPAETHNGHNDPDVVRSATRSGIINQLDQTVPQWPHVVKGKIFALGQPSFDSWPAALSLEHQQMHVTEIKRAYDGGLRLLFASVTDNELVHDLWNNGVNAKGNPIPTPTGTYDYESAKKQLASIQDFVAANSSWMQIVTSAGDAREVIRQDKLAVVLSLEMDSLSGDQILDLASQFGVRHVIAVHLSNNTIGGTATYDDLWNANTFFLTGDFFQVRKNKCISFRLGVPQHLTQGPLGAILTVPIDYSWFASLGYTDVTLGGHENDRGLNANEFTRLMNAGLLLDIAHMGHKSADGALALGEQYGYPLMDSHTGLRDYTDCSKPPAAGVNERSIPFSQVARIAKLGGVLGLGTATNNTADAVATWVSKYLEALNLMGGKRVALGTDTNGLSPQIFNNFYKLPTSYPVTVQKLFDAPAEVPQQLWKFKLLAKKFDFATDGLANYGLLPDFFQAIQDHPDSSWSPCVGQCQSCADACNVALQGDTNACLQSCQAQFPNLSPIVPNPAARDALKAIYHSAKDVLDMWDQTDAVAPKVPIPEGVQCSVFDMGPSGPTNVAGPSDAIYVHPVLDKKKHVIGRAVCVPANNGVGTCRKFFGLCRTVNTNSAVTFSVFNDGEQNRLGPVKQIFFDTSGRACISGEPAIAPDGTCRKWFGDAGVADGRDAACSVFDDGFTAPIGKSTAIFVAPSLAASRASFDSCVPTGPNGVCKKWFGRCIAWPAAGR